ncbi:MULTISPECIES: aspartate--tRNA ligase [unclassified Novosphingobium]|uniref:aspartate--tRNA ligase n=1 Tax=unclassified Novosphingobium TaxID=2644732 RepID=UPI001494BE66|nr:MULTISPECIES: aspartate--tRNA ligase [unclassified Novosphingobium]MBB3360543.1 aspartyl-tRNA synthetase [Novosphingobium sp. BK256]MBB3376946.1 aspartyl-tRNA synthetase [Novosphingobium sp. BK280]MBB3381322.1 aspartyl-tRNA synthetase [Novosphingobium sp. BK258]MBB3423006.1 aspartyl-tRNA synthetase [Novosphingobium sp. BK267]MBB3451709.1 aspartyl-tRNA synthetase [Novosphingobium sp. BK352]
MHPYRSHTCGALSREHVGENVRLSGWVHRKRDHGGVLFVDLRDHYGITQIVADSDSPALPLLESVRVESVVTIEGVVKARNEATVNANLATGAIEVFAKVATVLSAAEELPMPVAGEQEYPEDIRLRYRFLDLRRETLHANIVTRTRIISDMRRRMEGSGFTEYSTPILTASSPEGARDFLVPSRIHAGKFYALPQAPQQYKQLLMVAGFDRYFQIAPCFRDEDPRADRLPGEFYQLDLEMSFVTQEEVWETMEPVIGGVFEAFAEGKPVTPIGQFPRIPYDEAILKYGSDKPDLRNPLLITDVSHHFTQSGFGLFEKIVGTGGVVRAIPAPNTADKSRKFFDEMNDWARAEGHAGLGYVTRKGGEFGGPIAKNHGAEGMAALYAELGLGENDGLFFAAGKADQAAKLAGLARNRVAAQLGLVEEGTYKLCWIVDFPFYEWDEDNKKVEFSHNPFSMPQGGMDALTNQDPLTIKAFQYDLVCNGYEIASGSIRNQSPETMVKAFEIVGLTKADVEERFGGLYRAFQYGAPPHGGMAAGVDRIVMLLCGAQNLREITLFPMNQRAEDLLMGAPSPAEHKQLRELNIRVVEQPKG